MKKIYLALAVGLFLVPTILISQTVSISGQITRHNGDPVSDIQVNGFGTSVLSDADGNYEFTDVPNGFTALTASGVFDKFEDITVLDLLVIRRSINQIISLGNYQLLAGDVNNTHSITAYDLVLVSKLAIHLDDNVAPEWSFIDANYDFLMPNSNSPGSIDITVSGSDITDADFIAIKRGDVAISSDYMPPPSNAPSPVLTISNEYFQTGDNVAFKVSALDFTNIQGFQETFKWDPNLLELEEVIDFQGNNILESFGSTNFDQIDSGLLAQLFFSPTLSPVGFVNGSTLLTFKFKALADSPVAQTEVLEFGGQLIPRQIVWQNPDDAELYILEGEYVNGETTTSLFSTPEGLESFEIFPNPVEDNLHVKALLQNVEDFEISIVNVLGQEVFLKNFEQKELLLEIGFSEFSSGTYFLSLITADGIHTESFVKN